MRAGLGRVMTLAAAMALAGLVKASDQLKPIIVQIRSPIGRGFISVAMSDTAEETGATCYSTPALAQPTARSAACLVVCSSATTICCRRGYFVGIEGDISFPNYLDDGIVASRSTPSSAVTEKLDFVSTVRGRAGYAFDHWLFYATGGLAWSQARFLENSNSTGNEDKVLRMRSGWALGAGAELAIAPGWTARLEYLYDRLGKASGTFPSGHRLRIVHG